MLAQGARGDVLFMSWRRSRPQHSGVTCGASGTTAEPARSTEGARGRRRCRAAPAISRNPEGQTTCWKIRRGTGANHELCFAGSPDMLLRLLHVSGWPRGTSWCSPSAIAVASAPCESYCARRLTHPAAKASKACAAAAHPVRDLGKPPQGRGAAARQREGPAGQRCGATLERCLRASGAHRCGELAAPPLRGSGANAQWHGDRGRQRPAACGPRPAGKTTAASHAFCRCAGAGRRYPNLACLRRPPVHGLRQRSATDVNLNYSSHREACRSAGRLGRRQRACTWQAAP